MSLAQQRERILPRLIEDEMREAFLDYSMSVIVQRALPDVRDGLKPVHRRILFAMSELSLLPERPHKKCATVVGEVLGKYHPHGDVAVYDTLVRMVQDFSLRYPLVDGQGNFGSIDGDSAAAYRYTEARLAAISMEMLADIEKETVDWNPNFDDRLQEPSVLPARLPNLLVNGSSGIAVGMSTNIPPHNLSEIAGAFRLLIDNPDCTIAELMKEVPGPDFPTGGFLVGTEGIRDMYETGRGRLVMRARIVKEVLRGGREQLVVMEIPYGLSKARVIDQIVDLSKNGKFEEAADVRDESDRDGMRLVIVLKKGASAAKAIEILHQKTALQSTFGAILLALDRGEPKEFNLKQILERYRDHRLDVVVRRTRYDLEKAEAEKHIIEGLLLALSEIDKVIKIIRRSRDRAEASGRLQEIFGLSDAQADAILNMRLAKLTALEKEELEARRLELERMIEEFRKLLGSKAAQLRLIRKELDEVTKRFGDPRRTVILESGEEAHAPVEKALADEDVVVTVSREGFVKRTPVHLYRRRMESGKAIAEMENYENDWIERIFVARTRGWLLAFTEGGRAYFLSVLDLPESSRTSRGQSVYALIGAERTDRIVSILPIEDLSEAGKLLLFATTGGIVKRTELTEFSNPRAGGIIAAVVREGDSILDVFSSDGRADIILFTRQGRAIRFHEKDVPTMGRTAQGVKGIDLKGKDRVVGAVPVRRDAALLTVIESGWGKRTPLADFPIQKRGGLGTIAVPGSEGKGGALVGALEVVESDEVTVVTAAGGAISLAASKVPEQGRRTRGSKVVRLAAGDRVVEVTRSIGKEDEDAGSGRSLGGGGGGDEIEDGAVGASATADLDAETENFESSDGGEVMERVTVVVAEEREPAPSLEISEKPRRRGRGSAKKESEGLDLFES